MDLTSSPTGAAPGTVDLERFTLARYEAIVKHKTAYYSFYLPIACGLCLAGLGGALGAEVLGLDPSFPLKYMIYFLIVVAVGGTTSITGPLLAALLLGIADVAGKYYIPKLGAFIVYSLMIAILIWRPQGLFVRQGSKA